MAVSAAGGAIRLLDLTGEPEPLSRALDALAALPREGVVKLSGARDPAALLAALRERGVCAEVEPGSGRLELRPAGAAAILDLRDLEAPEPMQHVLEAAARLAPGGALLARTPCFPRPLLQQLERRGLRWQAIEEGDGSGLVHVGRPT
jgi:uncharacterized protein (DUF2249 family)